MTVHQMNGLTGLPYPVLSRWASDMAKQGRLREVGKIKNSYRTGRRVLVYCNGWKPPQDKLFHEWCITEFWLKHGANENDLRGPNVSSYLEDMEMPRGSLTFRVECFTGTQSKVQWLARLARYHGDKRIPRCDDPILVFVPRGSLDASRLVDRLIGWSSYSDLNLCFTTMQWIEEFGVNGQIWKDLSGEFHSLGDSPVGEVVENGGESTGEQTDEGIENGGQSPLGAEQGEWPTD